MEKWEFKAVSDLKEIGQTIIEIAEGRKSYPLKTHFQNLTNE